MAQRTFTVFVGINGGAEVEVKKHRATVAQDFPKTLPTKSVIEYVGDVAEALGTGAGDYVIATYRGKVVASVFVKRCDVCGVACGSAILRWEAAESCLCVSCGTKLQREAEAAERAAEREAEEAAERRVITLPTEAARCEWCEGDEVDAGHARCINCENAAARYFAYFGSTEGWLAYCTMLEGENPYVLGIYATYDEAANDAARLSGGDTCLGFREVSFSAAEAETILLSRAKHSRHCVTCDASFIPGVDTTQEEFSRCRHCEDTTAERIILWRASVEAFVQKREAEEAERLNAEARTAAWCEEARYGGGAVPSRYEAEEAERCLCGAALDDSGLCSAVCDYEAARLEAEEAAFIEADSFYWTLEAAATAATVEEEAAVLDALWEVAKPVGAVEEAAARLWEAGSLPEVARDILLSGEGCTTTDSGYAQDYLDALAALLEAEREGEGFISPVDAAARLWEAASASCGASSTVALCAERRYIVESSRVPASEAERREEAEREAEREAEEEAIRRYGACGVCGSALTEDGLCSFIFHREGEAAAIRALEVEAAEAAARGDFVEVKRYREDTAAVVVLRSAKHSGVFVSASAPSFGKAQREAVRLLAEVEAEGDSRALSGSMTYGSAL